jgi:cellobiose phosphorylase
MVKNIIKGIFLMSTNGYEEYADYRYEAQQLNEFCNQSREDSEDKYQKILENKRKYYEKKAVEKLIQAKQQSCHTS